MSNPPLLLAAATAILLLGCGSQPTVRSDDDPVAAGERDAGAVPAVVDAGKKDAASPPPKRDAGERVPTPVAPQDAGDPDAGGPRCGDGTREDVDGDGFTKAQGDCNDCLKTTSPAAFDVPGNGQDEDCSGGDDATAVACDQQLSLDSSDAKDAARAIDLCQFTETSSPRWGVISARFTDATGKGKLSDPRTVGMLPSFGAAKPRAGKALFALSSGVARAPGQAGFTAGCDTLDAECRGLFDECTSGGEPPPGYPQSSSTCSDQFGDDDRATIYNQAALELQLRAPSNANALSFESIFYTQEYPDFICSTFNDFFVVFREPAPAQAADGNILFDKNHDPIGVNTGLLSVCDPAAQRRGADKRFECEQGTALLKGTGYGAGESTCLTSDGGGASTGWLKTTAPVIPGELVTLRFAIWDTNDALLDSIALLDHFTWITYEGEPEKEIEIETEPVPFI